MKHKGLFIAALVFFLLVNMTYYWEGHMGGFALITFFLLVAYFLLLIIFLFTQSFFAIKENFINKQRIVLIGTMTAVLVLSFCYPSGIINFERFESKSIFIAQREGVANCMTTLNLRINKTFIEKTVCFGVTETTGTYNLKGDTIFFENISLGRHANHYYKLAVIKAGKGKNHLGDLVRYRDYSDTTGMFLSIIKNDLTTQ